MPNQQHKQAALEHRSSCPDTHTPPPAASTSSLPHNETSKGSATTSPRPIREVPRLGPLLLLSKKARSVLRAQAYGSKQQAHAHKSMDEPSPDDLEGSSLNAEVFVAALAAVTPEARQRFQTHGRPWDCKPDRSVQAGMVSDPFLAWDARQTVAWTSHDAGMLVGVSSWRWQVRVLDLAKSNAAPRSEGLSDHLCLGPVVGV